MKSIRSKKSSGTGSISDGRPPSRQTKAHRSPIRPSWRTLGLLLSRLERSLKQDGLPDLIIGIGRGGLVPAVWLSNRIDRPMTILMVKRNVSRAVHAAKIDPILLSALPRAAIEGQNVLIVEDIIGSGATVGLVNKTVASCQPQRIRVLTCYINLDNYRRLDDPSHALPEVADYVGSIVRGWVVFPWER